MVHIDWHGCNALTYIRTISSYIKIHLHESKDVRHINTTINNCHTHFVSQKKPADETRIIHVQTNYLRFFSQMQI